MLNIVNPLTKVPFVDRIFKFTNLNLLRIIELSHTNENFREVAEHYSVKEWNELIENFKDVEFENSAFSKKLLPFPWVVNRLNIPVDKFLNNFVASDLETVKKAVELCLEIKEITNNSYNKFIDLMIGSFRYNVVVFLLEQGANPNFVLKEAFSRPSFSNEKRRVLKQIVLYILEHFENNLKIPFELFDNINSKKETLNSLADLYFLMCCLNSSDNNKIKYYLSYMQDIDTLGPFGKTALNFFSGLGNRIILEYLTLRGANTNFQDKNHGYSPLMRAVVSNDIDSVEYLLLNYANPDLLDKSGCTSLHWAVSLESYDLSIIKRIFWANPENLYVKDNDNKSVKDWAKDDIVQNTLEDLEKDYLDRTEKVNRKRLR